MTAALRRELRVWSLRVSPASLSQGAQSVVPPRLSPRLSCSPLTGLHCRERDMGGV